MLWRNFPKADIRAGTQHFATLDDCNADKDETGLAVLALLACVAHRLECGDFVN
jgi:hypothetical protein